MKKFLTTVAIIIAIAVVGFGAFTIYDIHEQKTPGYYIDVTATLKDDGGIQVDQEYKAPRDYIIAKFYLDKDKYYIPVIRWDSEGFDKARFVEERLPAINQMILDFKADEHFVALLGGDQLTMEFIENNGKYEINELKLKRQYNCKAEYNKDNFSYKLSLTPENVNANESYNINLFKIEGKWGANSFFDKTLDNLLTSIHAQFVAHDNNKAEIRVSLTSNYSICQGKIEDVYRQYAISAA